MPSVQYSMSVTGSGVQIASSAVRITDSVIAQEIEVPTAKALSSWTKTDGDTAAGNLAGGHGWTTGTYDVYWDGGARYDVDVTITTNACALDGGTGDDFPATSNATVVLAKQTAFNLALDGDNADFVSLCLKADPSSTVVGRVLLEDAGGDDITDLTFLANSPRTYDIVGGSSNPFTGDPIATGLVSQSGTSVSVVLQVVAAVDATP